MAQEFGRRGDIIFPMDHTTGVELAIPGQIPLEDCSMTSGRPFFGSVHLSLKENQSVIADAGSLLYLDSTMEMETNCEGGCITSCGRSCAGESCCLNKYTGKGNIGLSFLLPGDIIPLALYKDAGWMLSKGCFVCCSDNVKISLSCSLCNSFQGSLAGESMVYTKCTLIDESDEQPGLCYAGGFGAIEKHEVKATETLYVDNGMFFAGNTETKLRIYMFGGLKNCCLGGEGIVMYFRGPCTILTQNRDPSLFIPPAEEEGSK